MKNINFSVGKLKKPLLEWKIGDEISTIRPYREMFKCSLCNKKYWNYDDADLHFQKANRRKYAGKIINPDHVEARQQNLIKNLIEETAIHEVGDEVGVRWFKRGERKRCGNCLRWNTDGKLGELWGYCPKKCTRRYDYSCNNHQNLFGTAEVIKAEKFLLKWDKQMWTNKYRFEYLERPEREAKRIAADTFAMMVMQGMFASISDFNDTILKTYCKTQRGEMKTVRYNLRRLS